MVRSDKKKSWAKIKFINKIIFLYFKFFSWKLIFSLPKLPFNNNIAILESKIIYFCLKSNFPGSTTLNKIMWQWQKRLLEKWILHLYVLVVLVDFLFEKCSPNICILIRHALNDVKLTKSSKKNQPALRAHSHRALGAQLASLASLSARFDRRAARSGIFERRASRPFFLDLALRARSCALRIHLSVFLIIWYWSSNQSLKKKKQS